MTDKYLYEEFTWPEIRDAVAQNRVAVLPVGTIEQHGPHLPLVTDVLTASEMSRRAVQQIPGEAVLLPSVFYAFSEHHLDFPAPSRARDTFINYVTELAGASRTTDFARSCWLMDTAATFHFSTLRHATSPMKLRQSAPWLPGGICCRSN